MNPQFFILVGIFLCSIPLLFWSVSSSPSNSTSSSSSSSSQFHQNKKNSTKPLHQKLPIFDFNNNNNNLHQKTTNNNTTICPPFSTVEGGWGLNNPFFNSIEYLSEQQQEEENNGDDVTTKIHKREEFGTWIFGSRKYSRRTMQSLRKKDASVVNNNNNNNNNNNTIIITLDTLCRSKTPHLQAVSPCAWDAPEKFTPFAGSGLDFDLSKSVALYKTITPNKNSKNNTNHLNQFALSWCYDFVPPQFCLQNKTILFFGDSHIRNIAQILCRMLVRFSKQDDKWFERGPCGSLDSHFDSKLSQVYLPRANCTIAYLRVRYNLQEQMEKRFLSSVHNWQNNEELIRNADVIVYGRGLWDIVMADKPRRKVVLKDVESDLLFLAQKVFWREHQRIIFKLPHYVHYRHRDNNLLFNLRVCANWRRQVEERDAVICAVSRAMKKLANNNTKKISIFDTFGATRQVPVLNGTDHYGHHFEGSVGESLVQMFLNIVCPTSSMSNFDVNQKDDNNEKKFRDFIFSSFVDDFAKVSCDRILETEDEMSIEKCSCGTPENVKSEEGKAYCEKLKKKNIKAPFIVDA